MAREDDVHGLDSIRIAVGLSGVVGVTVIPGQVAVTLKYVSGGTNIDLGGTALVSGSGYPLATTEIFNMTCAGTFYMTAAGATAIIAVVRGKSSGF